MLYLLFLYYVCLNSKHFIMLLFALNLHNRETIKPVSISLLNQIIALVGRPFVCAAAIFGEQFILKQWNPFSVKRLNLRRAAKCTQESIDRFFGIMCMRSLVSLECIEKKRLTVCQVQSRYKRMQYKILSHFFLCVCVTSFCIPCQCVCGREKILRRKLYCSIIPFV